MKGILALLYATTLWGVGLSAQSSKQTTTSEITVKEGKEVKVTGCIERADTETGFMLTKVADKRGALPSYVLVSHENEHLVKHVGHLVMMKGTATDRGDAKVTTETRTERSGDHRDHEIHAKTSSKGDLPHMAYLGVKSVKLVATACP
jgi:hypothetical protein